MKINFYEEAENGRVTLYLGAGKILLLGNDPARPWNEWLSDKRFHRTMKGELMLIDVDDAILVPSWSADRKGYIFYYSP